MGVSYGTKAILIIIIFLILFNFVYFVRSILDVSSNWAKYKCNPIIMPFVELFGVDTKKNFTKCVTSLQNKQIKPLLQPFNYYLESSGKTNQSNTKTASKTSNNLSTFSFNIGNKFNEMYSLIGGLMIEIQKIVLILKETILKVVAIIVVFLRLIQGSILTTFSIYNAFIKPLDITKIGKKK